MFMHLVSILPCGFQNEVKFERLGCASMETMTSDIASQCSQVTTFVGGLKRCYQSDKPEAKSNAAYSNASNTL